MIFVVFIYAHACRKFMHFVTKQLHRERHSKNPLPSTQCHGHDPEAADLTVYLAIKVSTFKIFFVHIYTYIYIHFHIDNYFHKITCIFFCNSLSSVTYLKLFLR